MTTQLEHPIIDDTDIIGSRLSRIDPNNFRNQSGAALEDGDDEAIDDDLNEEETDDEPIDEDGDPTGEHDHHQDDNYALGGHVTRSGSV
ncbi:hypothetical protein [Spirosoma koreense]